MAFSIQFSFAFSATDDSEVGAVLRSLRRFAIELPISDCSDIIELDHQAILRSVQKGRHQRLLAISAKLHSRGQVWQRLLPKRVVAFWLAPTQNSESVCFGLGLYPSHPQEEEQSANVLQWTWAGFCKTLSPRSTDIVELQRCVTTHVLIIRILDRAAELGMDVVVEDPTHFWEHRDVQLMASALVEDPQTSNKLLSQLASERFFADSRDTRDCTENEHS